MKRFVLFLGVFFLCLGVGIYRLSDIPGDWYGDISIVHEYVIDILSGGWPWHYSTSAGPLYHYIAVPWVAWFGHGYIVYKSISVGVGMIALIGTFLLASDLLGFGWAAVTILLAGTSFWWVVWERTGNSQMLIVALVPYSLWLANRWQKTARSAYAITGASVSSLGLFVYPQLWVLPVIYFLLLALRGKRASLLVRQNGLCWWSCA